MGNEISLPLAPARLFLVGIGGIGMSALAQLLRWQGYDVAGSDRGLNEAGKAELYGKLKLQSIRLYPQDGSGVLKEKPDALIVSTAVEEGNPDFCAIPGILRIHRASALSQALMRIKATEPSAQMIAVGGSCGKTSVTGWIGAALKALGEPVLIVNGGYYSKEISVELPGNFYADSHPRWLVAEVDESDHSILNYSPDYGVVLNISHDHYELDELRRVFGEFLRHCAKGGIVLDGIKDVAPQTLPRVAVFGGDAIHYNNYASGRDGITFDVPGFGRVKSGEFGEHSASNATAVLATLSLLGLKASRAEMCAALSQFHGIKQRFELIGTTAAGVPVVNDYAHNPEKVAASMRAAMQRFGKRMLAVFQPHGFTPLRTMRAEFVQEISALAAHSEIHFVLLPVFYAGGTAIKSPTSAEVSDDLSAAGVDVEAGTREGVEALLAKESWDCLLVMGARDSSLRLWCKKLLKLAISN